MITCDVCKRPCPTEGTERSDSSYLKASNCHAGEYPDDVVDICIPCSKEVSEAIKAARPMRDQVLLSMEQTTSNQAIAGIRKRHGVKDG